MVPARFYPPSSVNYVSSMAGVFFATGRATGVLGRLLGHVMKSSARFLFDIMENCHRVECHFDIYFPLQFRYAFAYDPGHIRW